MVNTTDNDSKSKSSQPPAPETLRAQVDASSDETEVSNTANIPKLNKKLKHGTYKPSYKATFIGAIVIVVILGINAAIIFFVINNKTAEEDGINHDEVTISAEVLDTLGVSSTPIGDTGAELTFGPDSVFKGKVTIASDINIGGEMKLNGMFSASDASLGQLKAGDTAVEKLNVNGDATVSNLSLRTNLAVSGSTQMQGTVTVGQLMTVNNSMNVIGNLSVGGTLSMGGFQTNILTIGGHIKTMGYAPSITPGSALGNNGTVSISGNDVAGTIAVNFGTNGGGGVLASVSFVTPFTNIPKVVVSPIGCNMNVYVVSRNMSGFTIATGTNISSIGCAVDYILMQ